MSEKDNQHFVQRAYLKRFAVDERPGEHSGELWVYDKKDQAISDSAKSIRDICSKKHYYAAYGEDGEIDPYVIEDELGKKVEDQFIRVLDSIRPSQDQVVLDLSLREQRVLAGYIGMQYARVPMFRRGVERVMENVFLTMPREAVNRMMEKQPEEVKEFFERGGEVNVRSESPSTISVMKSDAKFMADSLLMKQWRFMVPHVDIPLIISDNPVVTARLTEEGLVFGSSVPTDYQTLVFMPLRKDLAVVIAPCEFFETRVADHWKDNLRVQYMNRANSKESNRYTAYNAMRYVYNGTKDKRLGKMVFKFKPRKP